MSAFVDYARDHSADQAWNAARARAAAMPDAPSNPPAYPGGPNDCAGMSLADHFAAHAMMGLLADADGCPSPDVGARLAFSWADAMLRERARRAK